MIFKLEEGYSALHFPYCCTTPTMTLVSFEESKLTTSYKMLVTNLDSIAYEIHVP
jgi:hypothetical protein